MHTNIDFPQIGQLSRSMIGFDGVAKMLSQVRDLGAFPPYNLEKTGEDAYRLTFALAGFAPADISIETLPGQLKVSAGRSKDKDGGTFIYKGIAARAFEKTVSLAEHVKVTGAAFEHGLLSIDLVREVPEASKPRKIEISATR